LQAFLAAQGLQGLQAFLAAQGLQGLQAFLAAQGLQGLQAFLAAHGLQGLSDDATWKTPFPLVFDDSQGFFFFFFLAAHGLQGLQAFLAAQGLQGLQAFLAAQGLQGLQAFLCFAALAGSAPVVSMAVPVARPNTIGSAATVESSLNLLDFMVGFPPGDTGFNWWRAGIYPRLVIDIDHTRGNGRNYVVNFCKNASR